MKKMLIGTLAAASAVLMLSGCQHTSTGDGRTYSPSDLASPSVSASVVPTQNPSPVATATATPDVPQPSFPVASPTQSTAPISTPTVTAKPATGAVARAKSQLASLTVAEADYSVDYNRTKDFGPAWEDVDHNGCDTRNDILKRDLTNIVYRSDDPTCTVATGTLADPYTGKAISFERGVRTSSLVQIDHVVPLGNSIRHGADSWTQERREAFANDPFNLIAVDGPTNGSKSDSGPADWLPPVASYRCAYVEHYIGVSAKYDLTISRRDAATSSRILSACE